MLDYFFSNKHAKREDLFEGLAIWQKEKYRTLQGTYPVLFLSFAGIKQTTFENTRRSLNRQYATDLIYRGIKEEQILKYGFAFEGETCLIMKA